MQGTTVKEKKPQLELLLHGCLGWLVDLYQPANLCIDTVFILQYIVL